MFTEDDTFAALKRTPIAEMANMVIKLNVTWTGDYLERIRVCHKMFEEHGWTSKSYEEARQQLDRVTSDF